MSLLLDCPEDHGTVPCHADLLYSCPALCNLMDCSPLGSSVHGDSPGKNTGVGCYALLQGIFPTQGSNLCLLHLLHRQAEPTWKPKGHGESEVVQLCPTLCDPLDCSLSGSSVHGIFQARVLEWIAISFSRGSSRPRNRTRVSRIAGRHFTI